jgi:histone-lysine N-methyltransferase SETMAR
MIGISKNATHRILAENLNLRKLCARWVPHLLTMAQKPRREDVSISCLAMFHSNKGEFLHRLITMDSKWVLHFTRRSKEQSKQWTKQGDNRLQRRRRQLSAGKVLVSLFLDARGIIFIVYFQKRKTIIGEYYTNLLQRLRNEIKTKRPHLASRQCTSSQIHFHDCQNQ